MKNHFILAIATLLLFSCSSDKRNSLEHFSKAKELYKNNDINNASSEIELAIKLDSTNLDFQITKAKIISKTENFEMAIAILMDISNKKFKLDTVNFELGSCYFDYAKYFSMKQNSKEKEIDAYEKAITYYNNAINLNMLYFKAYDRKQKALHNLYRYDEALIVLNTAINLFPDSTSLICNRGIEKMEMGDLTGGVTDISTAIESNKLTIDDLATAFRFRGILLFRKGQFDQAIFDLNNSINYNPKDQYTYFNRAECYKAMGIKDKACEDYRKSADLGFMSAYPTIKEYCFE